MQPTHHPPTQSTVRYIHHIICHLSLCASLRHQLITLYFIHCLCSVLLSSHLISCFPPTAHFASFIHTSLCVPPPLSRSLRLPSFSARSFAFLCLFGLFICRFSYRAKFVRAPTHPSQSNSRAAGDWFPGDKLSSSENKIKTNRRDIRTIQITQMRVGLELAYCMRYPGPANAPAAGPPNAGRPSK